MTNPTPAKLAKLMEQVQSRWKQPERRLVDSGEMAVLRGVWIATRDELLALENRLAEVRRLMAEIEDRLPVGRDIMFWVNDPSANLPFGMAADALGVSREQLSEELFKAVSKPTMQLLTNARPLLCPLCCSRK